MLGQIELHCLGDGFGFCFLLIGALLELDVEFHSLFDGLLLVFRLQRNTNLLAGMLVIGVPDAIAFTLKDADMLANGFAEVTGVLGWFIGGHEGAFLLLC